MHETKILRFAAAMTMVLATIFFATYAKASAMTIDSTRLNTIQNQLKDRKIAFGGFDVSTLFDTGKITSSGNADGSLFAQKESEQDKERSKKAVLIDTYFDERSMPLEGYGYKMVMEAEKNNLDWRLLPAIAIRESSGGKFAHNNNPFGWASCKVGFDSFDDAIETVAWNLGGGNPNTQQYYSGDTRKKLYHYNGTVIAKYVDDVLNIMHRIDDES